MKRTMSRRAFWGALIGRTNHAKPDPNPTGEATYTPMPAPGLQADAATRAHTPILAGGVAAGTRHTDRTRKASAQELALLHDFPPDILALEARKYGLDPEADRETLATLLAKALSPAK